MNRRIFLRTGIAGILAAAAGPAIVRAASLMPVRTHAAPLFGWDFGGPDSLGIWSDYPTPWTELFPTSSMAAHPDVLAAQRSMNAWMRAAMDQVSGITPAMMKGLNHETAHPLVRDSALLDVRIVARSETPDWLRTHAGRGLLRLVK